MLPKPMYFLFFIQLPLSLVHIIIWVCVFLNPELYFGYGYKPLLNQIMIQPWFQMQFELYFATAFRALFQVQMNHIA